MNRLSVSFWRVSAMRSRGAGLPVPVKYTVIHGYQCDNRDY
ncbi:Uncharacterised protein [Mycobacterium tuberculosis]|nr:Uncharacterised protein [Mycobacterium tuberculosis]